MNKQFVFSPKEIWNASFRSASFSGRISFRHGYKLFDQSRLRVGICSHRQRDVSAISRHIFWIVSIPRPCRQPVWSGRLEPPVHLGVNRQVSGIYIKITSKNDTPIVFVNCSQTLTNDGASLNLAFTVGLGPGHFLQELQFTPGTAVFSGQSGFLQEFQYSTDTPVCPRYSSLLQQSISANFRV